MSDRLELYVSGQPFDGGDYHYTECGLDYVYLLNGFCVEQDAEYGKLVSFESPDDLHSAIGLHVIQGDRPLAAVEFRFLRKQMKLTQAELARKFGVDPQTIANYEKGSTPIPKTTDGLIRVQFLLGIMPDDMHAEFLKEIMESKPAQRKRSASGRKQIVHFWEETSLSEARC